MPLWALVALVAAATQTARNAAQASLTATIGTVGATQVRFLFGLPFAVVFLALAMGATGEALPSLTSRSLAYTSMGAMAQIGATALMRDPLSWPALGAIAIATSGVLVMSLKPARDPRDWLAPGPALTGLAAAALFGLSAIGFRGGVTGLESGGTLIRATATLVLSLMLQTGTLLIWMGLFDRNALAASLTYWRGSLGAGFLGAFASQFWFLGFALTSAANIRTLALAEVIFSQIVARLHFGQKLTPRQAVGMGLIVLGVGLLLQFQH